MNVFPVAIAYGRYQKAIMPGKLKGTIAAVTPIGWRIIISAMPRATPSRLYPCIIIGMPQATSTFSMARRISALASVNVLPFSRVMMRAISSTCSSSNTFNLKSGWMRSSGGVRRHSGKAAAAASTAALTSAASAIGTWAITSPVAGFTTSRHSELCESVHLPLMKLVSLMTGGAATLMRMAPIAKNISRLLHQLRHCALLITDAGDCRFEHVQRLAHLFVGHDQRHQHANHIAVRSRCDCDQAMLIAILRDLFCLVGSGSFRLRRLHQFDGLHATQAAHIADDRPAPLPFSGATLEAFAKFIGSREKIFALE